MQKHFIGGIAVIMVLIIIWLSKIYSLQQQVNLLSAMPAPSRASVFCALPRQRLPAPPLDSTRPVAPLLKGLGNYHFPVTTKEPQAQLFFDQGIRLYYAFNHMEAYRSFLEASRIDPSCAMSYWGQALSLGPNINAPMDAADISKVVEAGQKARSLAALVTPREQAYIAAIATRYAAGATENRQHLDEAYAAAMQQLHRQYPKDLDAAALYAESIMDLHPWEYWQKNGQPQPWTPEILQLLETVLQKDKDHPGANHFYIHAVEASSQPEKAMASARRLPALLPGAGHLVHMPSHIYIRTGMYHDGTLVNEASIKADQAYINQCNSQGLYALFYHPHNYHFLWACATLEGRSGLALEAATTLAGKVDTPLMRGPFGFVVQYLYASPLFAKVRFGKWDELLQTPSPDKGLVFVTAIWHYARGIAYVRKDRLREAEQDRQSILALMKDTSLPHIRVGARNTPEAVMAIAEKILAGEIAARKKDHANAIAVLTEAVKMEDDLNYTEPADWPNPVREILGAVLLEAGQYSDAEKCYEEELQLLPENGWALIGLYKSLKAQNRLQDAVEVMDRFDRAFSRADIKLNASRI